jgi:hypothetical protein
LSKLLHNELSLLLYQVTRNITRSKSQTNENLVKLLHSFFCIAEYHCLTKRNGLVDVNNIVYFILVVAHSYKVLSNLFKSNFVIFQVNFNWILQNFLTKAFYLFGIRGTRADDLAPREKAQNIMKSLFHIFFHHLINLVNCNHCDALCIDDSFRKNIAHSSKRSYDNLTSLSNLIIVFY